MPSRGFYEIASAEEGKVAQQDQSYRSCVLTLVIFFFLCLVLVLVTLPWKRTYGYNEEYSNPVEDYMHRTTQSTNTERLNRYTTDSSVSDETTEAKTRTTVNDFSKETSTISATVTESVTEDEDTTTSSSNNTESITNKEKSPTVETSTLQFSSTTTEVTLSTTLANIIAAFSNESELEATDLSTIDGVQTTTDGVEITTDGVQTTTDGVEITTDGVQTTTDGVEITTDGVQTTTDGVEITTDGVQTTTDGVEITTDGVQTTTDGVEITTDGVQTTTDGVEITTDGVQTTTDGVEITTDGVQTTTDGVQNTTDGVQNTTDGVEITTDGVQTTTDGVQNTTDGVQNTTDGVQNTTDGVEITTDGVQTTTDVVQTTTDGSTLNTVPSGTQTVTPDHGNDKNKSKVCTLGECKILASEMLFYMNHMADPCEDFYEYACGGFEANPHVVEYDLESAAYNRILKQVQLENWKGNPSLFSRYYNSCMHYDTLTLEEKLDAAEKALASVGTFYTTDNFKKDDVDFTKLVAELLLHNSALLFDVTPELEDNMEKHLTIKISPPKYKSPFEVEKTEDHPCYATQYERDEKNISLPKLYQEYETCKKRINTKFLNSVKTALLALGAFKELNNASSIFEYVKNTVNISYTEIVHKFLENLPSKNQIREAYLLKRYDTVSIAKLKEEWKIIDWSKLFTLLTGKNEIYEDVRVHVYFYDDLTKRLKDLEQFGSKHPMELNNALLGLYAQAIYQQLIVPKHADPKNYCVRVAANLLIPEASSFYLSTFSKEELLYMNHTIQDLFVELKETLKVKINELTRTSEENRKSLVAKIDKLTVVTPNASYFACINLLNDSREADEVLLSDNYLNDSITLMKRYRKRMYNLLTCQPGCDEQIWTYYTTPFQSKGLVIYELQLVVIPYGAIDWSVKYNESLLHYIKLATIGNTIAHQIARYFNANGIHYQSKSQSDTPVFDYIGDWTFENYINCHKNMLYEKPLSMSLFSTEQNVSYTIPQLALNERLSESMGLRLTYDTWDRMRSHEEVHLPWLDLDLNQLFYLTYAQMHCSKLPLTSSYVTLYEDEKLPSRISIFVSVANNQHLRGAWKCPSGSGNIPSYSCDVFPYLSINEEIPEDDESLA